MLRSLNLLFKKTRSELTEEGRQIRDRIEALGYPQLWGKITPEILAATQAWQQKCARAGLSQAAVYQKLGKDIDHISGAQALLIVDETLLALDPPGSVGG